MSEVAMVLHCAPTLAAIKTANLVSYEYDSVSEMREAVRSWNCRLRDKGVRVLPLRYQNHKALLYIYRPSRLAADFRDQEAKALLHRFGYSPEKTGQCILRLIKRLHGTEEFPHEIGLFLGYPPEDVAGFICHHAKEYKCVGCWKVYGDEEKCRKLFAAYRQCTRQYSDDLRNGVDVAAMTISE